jgi:hypothetical protein
MFGVRRATGLGGGGNCGGESPWTWSQGLGPPAPAVRSAVAVTAVIGDVATRVSRLGVGGGARRALRRSAIAISPYMRLFGAIAPLRCDRPRGPLFGNCDRPGTTGLTVETGFRPVDVLGFEIHDRRR